MQKIMEVCSDGATLRKTCDERSWTKFVRSMVKNNTYCPAVKRVIYNLKTSETVSKKDENGKPVLDPKGRAIRETVQLAKPILATIVEFSDGTKTVVVNSDADVVKTTNEEVVIASYDNSGKKTETKTGKFATVATDAAKEAGLVYAIVKRLFGSYEPNGNGNIIGNGLGRKLKDIIKFAYDIQLYAARNEAFKAKAAKEHKDREAAAKARKANRKPSFEDNVAIIADYVRKQTETSETKTV